MFAFANPICWLKKPAQPNSNTKTLCDPLSEGELVSQPGSPRANPTSPNQLQQL